MRIKKSKCAGCGQCVEYCAIGKISACRRDARTGRIYYEIDEDECVDCGVCLRAKVCETGALFMPKYQWPRTIRANFSDPLVEHPETKVPGRGTEEMKTNEVTGRIKPGFVGIACEMGRPAVGARFRDTEKVAMALARLGVEFEPKNPTTTLMADPRTGRFNEEVLDEKVLSCIIEMIVAADRAPDVLRVIRQVASDVDCVFSVDLISHVGKDGSVAGKAIVDAVGWPVAPNGKLNTGLGRPLAREA
jgi:NAD-dependent dihydropyrimidine dehydrogenase PreA subunit